MRRQKSLYVTAALLIVGAAAGLELAMGRVPICRCGYIKWWHGIVYSSETSQHIADILMLIHPIEAIREWQSGAT
jgi:hypothetical protein